MRVKNPALPSLIMTVAICAAMCLFAAPQPAHAENLIYFHSADLQHPVPALPHAPAAKQGRLALDDDGNVMVRFNRMSVTFIYDAGGPPQENRMRSDVAHQEVACLGGLSVKFGMTF